MTTIYVADEQVQPLNFGTGSSVATAPSALAGKLEEVIAIPMVSEVISVMNVTDVVIEETIVDGVAESQIVDGLVADDVAEEVGC